MTVCCDGLAPSRSSSQPLPNFSLRRPHVVDAGDDDRLALERFIRTSFDCAYGARITHYCRHLLGWRDGAGRWGAAAGYTPASRGPLFLEQYLDGPVQEVLTRLCGKSVTRHRIVEVGHLSALPAGMGRELIVSIGRHLQQRGFDWVVFTATRELRNAFRRLRLAPLQIVRADPARLADRNAGWGSYYAHDPAVMAGNLAVGMRSGLPQ